MKALEISNDEIARLLQSSKPIYIDRMPIHGTSIEDIDLNLYSKFLYRKLGKQIEDLDLTKSLENLGLVKSGQLTLAGLLLFSENRSVIKPEFSIQCVAVNDVTLAGNHFIDNEPAFDGTLSEVYLKAFGFIDRNIRKVQSGTSFNSPAVWEIPQEVFEEVLVNALIHRDYLFNQLLRCLFSQIGSKL